MDEAVRSCFFPWCGVGGKLCIDCSQRRTIEEQPMERPGSVRVLLIDCDGVMTNGEVSVDQHGNRFKVFNARDSRAIAELVACGWEVHIITASAWSGLLPYLERSPAIVHVDCTKDRASLEAIIARRPFAAVGDDAWDINMLMWAARGMAFCPQDADPEIRKLPQVRQLPVNGGRGVLAELVRVLGVGRPREVSCSHGVPQGVLHEADPWIPPAIR